MTQSEKILDYMRQRGNITQLDAMLDIGCMRLGARIWEIKNKMGVTIKTEMVPVKNRFGETCYVASYSIQEGAA